MFEVSLSTVFMQFLAKSVSKEKSVLFVVEATSSADTTFPT
jgi:hypothetical protein